MKKFESQQLPSLHSTREGWSVQVYSSDRRLLCSLEPSHGWMFLLGCGMGLLLAVIWVNLARYSPSVDLTESQQLPELRID